MSDNSLARIATLREVAWGVTPAAALKVSKMITSETVTAAPETATSAISSGRRSGITSQVFLGSSGALNVEAMLGDEFFELLEMWVASDWVNTTTGALTDVSFTASGNTIDRVSGSFVTDGFLPDQWIEVAGSASNDTSADWAKIVSVTALQIVVAYHVLVDEVAGASITISGRRLRDGSVTHSMVMERDRTDLIANRYRAYNGMIISGGTLTFNRQSFITGSMQVLAKSPTAPSSSSVGTGGPTAADTELPLDVSNHMKAFRAAGVLDGEMTQVTIQLANNSTLRKVAQTSDPQGGSHGLAALSGTTEGYLVENDPRESRAASGAGESMDFRLTRDGTTMYVTISQCDFTTSLGDVARSNPTGEVIASLPWTARESTDLWWIQFCRPAA